MKVHKSVLKKKKLLGAYCMQEGTTTGFLGQMKK